jgi:hypothetical protein
MKYLAFVVLNVVITSVLVAIGTASSVAAAAPAATTETICFLPRSAVRYQFSPKSPVFINFKIVGRPYAKLTFGNGALVVCDEADPPAAESYLWKLFPKAGC